MPVTVSAINHQTSATALARGVADPRGAVKPGTGQSLRSGLAHEGPSISDKVTLRPTAPGSDRTPATRTFTGSNASNLQQLRRGELPESALLEAAKRRLDAWVPASFLPSAEGGREVVYVAYETDDAVRSQLALQDSVHAMLEQAKKTQSPQRALKLLGHERPTTSAGRPLPK
jgi:hypothetical protein